MSLNESLVFLADKLNPIVNQSNEVLSFVKWLTGGLFGLYLFLVVLRIYEGRQQKKEFKQIQKDLAEIKKALKKRSK